jgi:copper resistance protein B
MKNCLRILLLASSLASGIAFAHTTDDPLLFSMAADIAWQEDDQAALEGDLWVGRDLRKVWLKFDLEHADGELEEAELQALYGIAVAPYWDVQFGLRQDVRPRPRNTWGVLTLQGVAPYFIDTDLALFVGEGGAVAARLAFEYELLFTQDLSLSPAVELELHGQNDRETSVGSGLSEIEIGLQLSYQIRRELVPYMGVEYWKKFGNTADFARLAGEETTDTRWVVGLSFWF